MYRSRHNLGPCFYSETILPQCIHNIIALDVTLTTKRESVNHGVHLIGIAMNLSFIGMF